MKKQYANLLVCSNQNDLIIDNFSKLSMENPEHINETIFLNNKRKNEINISIKDEIKDRQLKKAEDKFSSPIKSDNHVVTSLSFKEFEILYTEYLNDSRFIKRTLPIKDNFEFKKQIIYEVLNFTITNGGFSEGKDFLKLVIGCNKIQKELIKTNSFVNDYHVAREILDKYVFHFIKFLEIRNKKCPEIEKILNLSPEFVIEIPEVYVSNKATQEDIEECMKRSFDYDLVFAKNIVNKLKLNKEFFTTSYLENHYPDLEVDVVEQNPNFSGFSFNWHTKKKWKMIDYVKYVEIQENYKDSTVHIKKDKLLKKVQILKDMIYYCVNVDLDDYPEIKENLERNLPSSIRFRGSNDILSYLRSIIKGMTSPQIYIKVTGTWTGGHEENLRFRSINMNHGPGASDWFGVKMKDSLLFRELVKKQYNMDIYKKEGIWFPNLEWFMTNKIEVYYGVQEQYDIATVGVGCLHWVRARNHSINSSWNFGTKDLLQIKSSFERDSINKQINFISLVKLNTLILDYMNNEMRVIPNDIFYFCEKIIRNAIEKSNEELDSIHKHFNQKRLRTYKEPYAYLIINCEKCNCEIFNYWGFCHWCNSNIKYNYQTIFCQKCFIEHDSHCDKKDYFYLFYKYNESTLQTFLNRINKRKLNEDLIDIKQLDISKYSLLGKEIASKDPLRMELISNKNIEKKEENFKSYNQFFNVIVSKRWKLYEN